MRRLSDDSTRRNTIAESGTVSKTRNGGTALGERFEFRAGQGWANVTPSHARHGSPINGEGRWIFTPRLY